VALPVVLRSILNLHLSIVCPYWDSRAVSHARCKTRCGACFYARFCRL